VTIKEVREKKVPALDNSPAMKMVSALRHQFGGHATRPAK